MLYFQPTRTARFTFELQELNLKAIRTLLNIAPHLLEKQRNFFLKNAIKSIEWHKGYEQNTLNDLTIQERLFMEGMYIATLSENMDFELGNGHFSNFLDTTNQFKHQSVELGLSSTDTDDKDKWEMKPLTAIEMELMEERIFATAQPPERIDWILFSIAASMYQQEDKSFASKPNASDYPVEYGDWLENRVKILTTEIPESELLELINLFFTGLDALSHLFKINFDDFGTTILPHYLHEEGEGVNLLPARFPYSATIDPLTRSVLGKY